MQCNCEKVTIQLIEEQGYEQVTLGNMTYSLSEGMRRLLTIPFYYRKRNPKTKKFYQKQYDIPVEASFCPFCGTSTKKKEDSGE